MNFDSPPSDPLPLFREWVESAKGTDLLHPSAVALATATPEGRPSARMVLFKGLVRDGFTFFTNLESRKANELHANPHAALLFYWMPLDRQIRVEGAVTSLADARYRGRPVPRPPHWGGYRLAPERIEFWQGGAHRIHDRILYARDGTSWTVGRLSP